MAASTDDCQKMPYVQLSRAPSISVCNRCWSVSWLRYAGVVGVCGDAAGGAGPRTALTGSKEEAAVEGGGGVGGGAQEKPWRSVEAMKASITEALSSDQRFIRFLLDHRRGRTPAHELDPWIPVNPGESRLGGSSDGRLLKTWKLGEGPWTPERGRGANGAEETSRQTKEREIGARKRRGPFRFQGRRTLLLPACFLPVNTAWHSHRTKPSVPN